MVIVIIVSRINLSKGSKEGAAANSLNCCHGQQATELIVMILLVLSISLILLILHDLQILMLIIMMQYCYNQANVGQCDDAG